MAFDIETLIYDRTQADVNRVKTLAEKGFDGMTEDERSEWLGGMKGAYNGSDLNRVGLAVEYIAQRMNELGYVVSVDVKTDWDFSEMPTEEQMQNYLSQVSVLRSVISLLPTTPSVPPDLQGLTYTEANNIEKLLWDIDMLLTNSIKAAYYSGELYSGEV